MAKEKKMRVLVVEDVPGDAELCERQIKKTLPSCEFRRVETRKEFLAALKEFQPAVIVSDFKMPQFDGLTALRLAQEHAPDVPFIILTGSAIEDTAVECMKAGAWDYVIKEHIKRLGPAVVRALKLGKLRRMRQTAETALRESEERFRSLFMNASLGIYQTTPDGRILAANPTLLRMLGYENLEELAQRNLEDDGYEPDYPRSAFKDRVERENVVIRLESAWKRKDGTTLFVRESARAVRGADGAVQYYEGIVEDITDRKRAQEREQLAAQILEMLNQSIEEVDVARKILLKIKRFSGIEAAGLRLKEGDDYPYYEANGFPQDFIKTEQYLCARDRRGEPVRDSAGEPVLECMCGNIIRGRTDPSLPFFTKGGSFWTNSTTELLASTSESDRQGTSRNRCNTQGYESVALIPLRTSRGTIGLLQLNDHRKGMFTPELIAFYEGIGTSIGVSLARKRAEDALRAGEQKYRTLVESLPQKVFHKDGQSVYVSCNKLYAQDLGIAENDIAGKTDFDFYPRELAEKYRADDRRVMELGDTVELVEGYAQQGEPRTVHTVKTPVRDEQGNVIGVLGVFSDISERMRMEAALREREADWESLIRATPAVILTADRDGKILFINRTISGFTLQDTIGKTAYDFVPTPYRRTMQEAIERVFETGEVVDYETQGAGPDGTVAWYSTRVGPIMRGGKVDAVILIATDITDHKRAEERKTALSALLALSLDPCSLDELLLRVLDLIFLIPDLAVEPRGAIFLVEDSLGTLVLKAQKGLAPALTTGCGRVPFGRCLCGRAALTRQIQYAGDLDSRHETTYEGMQPHGHYCVPIVFTGETLGVLNLYLRQGHMRDLAEEEFLVAVANALAGVIRRKQTVQDLRESEDRYRTLFDEARDGIGLADAETGTLVDCNRALCQMVERDRSELLGQPQSILHAPKETEDGLTATFRRHRGEESGKTLESLLISKSGKLIPVEIRAARFRMGGRDFIIGLFRDCTERLRLQEQFLQSQKMESVGRLAGGVAHDFNNMLGVIIGHTELALAQVEPDQTLHNDLQEILKAAERSADFTRQLLAFARKQTVSPKVLDLNKTVSQTLKMLQRLIGEDVELVWRPGEGLWPVKIDPAQVDQLLMNLATNARDAIKGVGRLTLMTENMVLDETYSDAHPGSLPGEHVVLTVSDTGAGMDKETLQHIFEPFFTTKEAGRGTGLGLATVYGIVKQNNGFINVYSEPDRGAVFKIYLPRTEAPTAVGAAPAGAAVVGGTETVLLVEDEAGILTLCETVLKQHGYTVLAARTPREALMLAETIDDPIHLLITDVVMPEMDGRQLREKLTALRPGLRVLFMSGYTADVIAHHGVLEEGVQFLQKPFPVVALAEKVRAVLDA